MTFKGRAVESLLVLNPIYKWVLSIGIDIDDIYLGLDEKNEFFISTDKKIYFYDFTIRSKGIIIEFHGTAFHVNPSKIIEGWKNPFTGQGSLENIEQTRIKNSKAIKKGFKLLEIWSDNIPEYNIELCKKFILNNI